jgi:primosomal protein N' (replication factor Y)
VVDAAVPTTLSYGVPRALAGRLRPGTAVRVPLGRRSVVGWIAREGPAADASSRTGLRSIEAVLGDDEAIDPADMAFLLDAADYYLAPPGEVLRAARPPVARGGTDEIDVLASVAPPGAGRRPGPRQRAFLEALAERGEIAASEARGTFGLGAAAIRSLESRGFVVRRRRAAVDPEAAVEAPQAGPEPNADQAAAAGAVIEAIREGRYRGFLLHGVTGSGKTEVYLRCAAEALGRGRSCLLLVPEIALTPQLVARVRGRLGERVAVVHSGLPDGRRRREWAAMRAGRIRVAVGARSALFSPLRDPGLVIVDEEHDPSYKQAERFRYHARDLAILRARHHDAVVLLGSATPSLESYRNARTGKLALLRLPERATTMPLAGVATIDLRGRTDRHPEYPFLSCSLVEALAQTLEREEQAILFLNRRGFAPAAVCEACGVSVDCGSCGVPLAYHRARRALLCHYCGFHRAPPERCEACGVGTLDLKGLGAEQVAAAVQALFPSGRVARLDSDVVEHRGAAADIVDRLHRREIDVLVGTQMVAKGHDLPGVTLVGIVRADLGLQTADFRAAERTFQLLTQVAGRAGRGDRPGRVLLQSFLPDHYAILAARNQDYDAFVRAELPARRELGYPPFGHLALVHGDAPDEAAIERAMTEIHERIGPAASAAGAELLGPCPAPLPRLRGRYRYQLIVKAPERASVRRVLEAAREAIRRTRGPVRLGIDVDPVHLT